MNTKTPNLIDTFIYEPEKGRKFDLKNPTPGGVIGLLFGNLNKLNQKAILAELSRSTNGYQAIDCRSY